MLVDWILDSENSYRHFIVTFTPYKRSETVVYEIDWIDTTDDTGWTGSKNDTSWTGTKTDTSWTG